MLSLSASELSVWTNENKGIAFMRKLAAAFTLAALTTAASSASADDVGKAMFAGRCGACHSVATTKSGPIAPSLKGVYGRKIASLPDFSYSAALKAKGGAWTASALDTFLTAPSAFAPGTKMFIAVTSPADRAALIGYLKTAK